MINNVSNRVMMEIGRQSRLADAIAESQIDISTGKHIQRGSEDPVAAARVSQIRKAQSNDDVWGANIELGLSLAAQADTVLSNLNDQLGRAQELMVASANGALSVSDRATFALELNGIAAEIDSYMATQSSLGHPLFIDGDARQMRFSESAVFAPVPSKDEVFGTGPAVLGQILRDAASAVTIGDATAMGAAQDAISAAASRTADTAADIGVRAGRMERLAQTLDQRAIDYASERSTLEDTNLAEAIAKLNAQTITLEAAQAAFARINRRTLLDILQ